MKRLHTVLAIAVMAGVLGGCSKSGVSDDSLANDVKARLYADPVAKQANISVAVKDGVVTLAGDAPGSDAELAAMKAANSATGVKRVDDQIKVNSATAQLPNAGNNTPADVAPPAQNAPPSSANPYGKGSASAPPPPSATAAAAPPRVAPVPVDRTVPSGTRVSVRTIDAINSKTAQVGQTFSGTLTQPLTANGDVVVPAGETATLVLQNAKSAGRISGSAQLEVRLQSISYQGRRYEVDSSEITEIGKGRGKQTAVRGGIGAAAGAIIGAIAGGGKGAAIGSAAGAGAGVGYQVFTHGQQVSIPSESVLVFTLQSPVTLR
jgi:BON domain